jgi:hypothetical protein
MFCFEYCVTLSRGCVFMSFPLYYFNSYHFLCDCEYNFFFVVKEAYCLFLEISQLSGATSVQVRFEVFTAVIMKNAVFWDIKSPVGTSQKTYYVSSTDPSMLILYNI